MSPSASPLIRRVGILFPVAFVCFAMTALAAGDANATPAEPIFRWRPFLGPFHSLVLHYPIGFLTMALVLEGYEIFTPGNAQQSIKRLVLHLSLWTGLAAAGLGWVRAAGGGYEEHAVQAHRIYGVAVPFATIFSLAALARARRLPDSKTARMIYQFSLLITLTLLVLAGHLGGNLTHGSNYLVQNAPPFVKQWMQEPAPSNNIQTNGLKPAESLFVNVVQPAFEKKCLSCHGSEKQKGKYRLDQAERALGAGESGKKAIVPGDPLQSHLFRLVLLPQDHDDVMPPQGKAVLTGEEILGLARWIQGGAPFVTGATKTGTKSP